MYLEHYAQSHIYESILVRLFWNPKLGQKLYRLLRKKMYKSIQQKFSPWVCLLHLDLAASISFQGYEVICNIGFYGCTEKKKYQRGIFAHRTRLSQLARELESHAEQMIPCEIAKTLFFFDIEVTTIFFMERYGLWKYIEQNETALIAAIVDGGQLAWKLTQISAGINIFDEHAIDPRNCNPLFGECVTIRVQSSDHCFPLQVHLAKDNKDFYNIHLSSFLSKLNEIEDRHPSGLKIAFPADMCSQVKTVKQGGVMKLAKYACYCCGIHADALAKPNLTRCDDCVRLGRRVCYHQQVTNEELLMHMEDDQSNMAEEYPHLQAYPFKNSPIRFSNDGLHGCNDPRHIEYVATTFTGRIRHADLVKNELKL
jgi:hypothetical protein